jgi:transcriptional regulator with XRE-family HTH domain
MASQSSRSTREIDALIGNRLRAARHAQHMSQNQLAAVLGIPCQQIQKYENGTNRISAARLFEIARALAVPITFFFGRTKQTQLARCTRRARSVG